MSVELVESCSMKEAQAALDVMSKAMAKHKLHTLVPILPLFLNLDGKPYTLEDHFAFEPFFSAIMPGSTVWKCGRQVSKCVSFDDDCYVRLENGRLARARDLQVGDKIIGLRDANHSWTTHTVKAIHDNGIQDTFLVKTKSGASFKITEEHRLRAALEYKPLSQLTVGDALMSLRRCGSFNDEQVSDSLISDTVLEAVLSDSKTSKLPDWVFDLNPNKTKLLLKLIYTLKGSVSGNHSSVSTRIKRLPSVQVAKQIQSLAAKFGVFGHVTVINRELGVLFKDNDSYSFIDLVSKRRFQKIDVHLSGQEQQFFAVKPANDTAMDVIVSISYAGKQTTYDIETDGDSNYLLDNVISHNSTSLAAQGLLLANSIPYFKILFITPLFEQIRRFSNNYVRPFIEQSPIRSEMVGTNTENSVLQRSFKNYSVMYFSYAYLTADRCRGLSVSRVAVDEIQDINPDLLPIIMETMSHAKEINNVQHGTVSYTGTPKTLDNTVERIWKKSSMGEWGIPCTNCKHLNIPAAGIDLEKMIGPLRDDISISNPAVVCAKCRKPINPKIGRWVHKHPEKRFDYAGYHVPQVIMPIHYRSKQKWAKLLAKQAGANNTTVGMFYNEVLGEGYDLSTKLISETDLLKAANMHENDEDTAFGLIDNYTHRVMGVDYGGGGEEGVSFTTIAIAGLTPTGQVHIIFGKRLLTPHDHVGEARECLRLFTKFRCHIYASDYSGAGTMRETFALHAGLQITQSAPIQYVRTASKNIINFVPATLQHPKNYYRIDKARSLQLICHCIKLGIVRFFKYDWKDNDNPGLVHDFLALIENKISTAHAGDIYTVIRDESFTDDFAHAVNLACIMLFHMTGYWPRFGGMGPLTPEQEGRINEGWV